MEKIWIFFVLIFISTYPLYAQQKKIYREDTEWANFFMENVNDTDLPHVLLIGNSITQSYSGWVTKSLKGKAYCSRLTTSKSLGDPAYLMEVELALQHNTFDVIHFNNGLHGHEYTEVDYIADLPKLMALFEKYAPKAKLIWATITPIRKKDEITKIDPFNKRVIKRNELVLDYLADKNVYINDLYSIMITHPEYYNKKDGIHLNEKGVAVLSKQVSDILLSAIKD